MSGNGKKVVLPGTSVVHPLIARWLVAIAEAEGFINLCGLPMKMQATLAVGEGDKPRHTAPNLATREWPADDGMD
jgi:hypothetical protein